MAKIQNTDSIRCWREWAARGMLTRCWWEHKMAQPLWKTVWQFLIKLNIFLPYNPAILLLGIYPNDLKTYIHTKTCTQVFITDLYITAKT
jgi:hypothetical protein